MLLCFVEKFSNEYGKGNVNNNIHVHQNRFSTGQTKYDFKIKYKYFGRATLNFEFYNCFNNI